MYLWSGTSLISILASASISKLSVSECSGKVRFQEPKYSASRKMRCLPTLYSLPNIQRILHLRPNLLALSKSML
ncbi:hypothetical protein B0O99DRAFT_633572 [Bisporella sp. PMI_857]|nr:hypothetical protein B0O99DRAFT_633572 [Bisporella sp. PMI_857]